MNLSWKTASILRVASVFALGAALVPLLAGPAQASGTINQQAPFSNAGTVTPATSAAFTDQLQTDSVGAVTFITTVGADFDVSSSGAVSIPSALAVGSYTVSGTDSDTLSNSGTWSYTLNVTAGTLATTPTTNATTVTPATSSLFTDQLATTGGEGAITYSQSGPSSPAGVLVSPTGHVTTSGPLERQFLHGLGHHLGHLRRPRRLLDLHLGRHRRHARHDPEYERDYVTPATSAGFTDLLATTGGEGSIATPRAPVRLR